MKENIRRVLGSISLVLLLLVATLALGTVKSVDANKIDQCPSNYLCLFRDINFSGGVKIVNLPQYGCTSVGSDFNKKISSIYNNTSYTVYLYVAPGCKGEKIIIRPVNKTRKFEYFVKILGSPKHGFGDIAWLGGYSSDSVNIFNDKIRSFRTASSKPWGNGVTAE